MWLNHWIPELQRFKNVFQPNPSIWTSSSWVPRKERTSPRNFGPPRQFPAICGRRSVDEGRFVQSGRDGNHQTDWETICYTTYNPILVGFRSSKGKIMNFGQKSMPWILLIKRVSAGNTMKESAVPELVFGTVCRLHFLDPKSMNHGFQLQAAHCRFIENRLEGPHSTFPLGPPRSQQNILNCNRFVEQLGRCHSHIFFFSAGAGLLENDHKIQHPWL